MTLNNLAVRPVSKRRQRAAFLQRVTKVEITAGSKKEFLVVVPLRADSSQAHGSGSLLVLNRTAAAIAAFQASLTQACCARPTCRVCSRFSNLPPLPVSLPDRLMLSGKQIHGHFEARLARIVHTAASLAATESHEANCVAQMQTIVSRFLLHGQPCPLS